MKDGEKINDCGIVTENHCLKRCTHNRSQKTYPGCDSDISDENMVKAAQKWIRQRCWKRKTIGNCSSYGLKHIMEEETNIYVGNGEFITAATLLGYEIKSVDYPNCWFNMGIKTKRNRRYWAA